VYRYTNGNGNGSARRMTDPGRLADAFIKEKSTPTGECVFCFFDGAWRRLQPVSRYWKSFPNGEMRDLAWLWLDARLRSETRKLNAQNGKQLPPPKATAETLRGFLIALRAKLRIFEYVEPDPEPEPDYTPSRINGGGNLNGFDRWGASSYD